MSDDLDLLVTNTESFYHGPAAQEFTTAVESFTRGDHKVLPSLADDASAKADALDDIAMNIEYAKLMIIANLAFFALQLAISIAWSAFTLGLTSFMIPAIIGMVMGAAQAALMDTIIQLIQESQGTGRTSRQQPADLGDLRRCGGRLLQPVPRDRRRVLQES